jgi:hypothetical protein
VNAAFSKKTKVAQAKDQVSCSLQEEAAILSFREGMYYGLNPVGARIWNLIREPKEVCEILDVMLREYEVDSQGCEKDLFALLERLLNEGLIEIKDETAS